MNTPHRIEIPCNPANPVNYLGCCGIFDLLSRMDDTALAHWEIQPPIRLILQTAMAEQVLLNTLTHTFCSPAHWRFITTNESEEVTGMEVTFYSRASQPFSVGLDWWYETLNADDSISKKSAWKMYAGQQTVGGIVNAMIEACTACRVATLADCLNESLNLTGRFGFDPRSSRNALDVGYSPNDLQLPVATYPYAELLAAFGAASFFPQRLGPIGTLKSTRGWSKDPLAGFKYCLWTDPLPVVLARISATKSRPPKGIQLFSERAHRKNYSNLTLAKPQQSQE
jgi:hypothetical protein